MVYHTEQMDMFIPICSGMLSGTVWYYTVQTEQKFLCSNRASSSKKWLGNSDISNLLNSSDITDKLLDTDECSDTDESSDTDFSEQENDVLLLLLDVGDNSGEVDTAYLSNNFLWEDVDNYIRQQETVSAVSWPEDSAKGQTNAIDIF